MLRASYLDLSTVLSEVAYAVRYRHHLNIIFILVLNELGLWVETIYLAGSACLMPEYE